MFSFVCWSLVVVGYTVLFLLFFVCLVGLLLVDVLASVCSCVRLFIGWLVESG